MTLAALRTQARRYARIDTTAADEDQVAGLSQDAIDKFARDVGGFPLDANLTISAAFDTETHFAFHVEIVENGSETVNTDVAITSTAREDASGTTVASDLQVALRAMTGAVGTETVTWTDFYFTIDFKQGNTASGDYIKLSAPTGVTYANALEILGLSSGTTTGSTTVTGGFPEDCTRYATLPADKLSVQRVEWDYYELQQVGYEYVQSSESTGDPTHYAIRGRRLYLVPSPDRQDRLEIWYRGVPETINFHGYQELTISGLSNSVETGLSTATQYYFKVAIDGGPVTEYNITTASVTTYSVVISLMNEAVSGATFSIVGGKLRCESDSIVGVSSISLSAGTTGTDLFATLTGWVAFEDAVDGDTNIPVAIPDQYQEALIWLTASFLAYESFDYETADRCERKYIEIMRRYRMDYANLNTVIEDNMYRSYPRIPKVSSRIGFS